MIVIKLGGTNGSGKSTLARAIIKAKAMKPVHNEAGKITGYAGGGWLVLGRYETACGGMDTLPDKHVVRATIEAALKSGAEVVFFEGLITGKTYGAIGEISERADGNTWVYAFMDTPFEECVRRVYERRQAAGNSSLFDPERTMRPTYRSVEATAVRAEVQGHTIHRINHKLLPEQAVKDLERLCSKLRRRK